MFKVDLSFNNIGNDGGIAMARAIGAHTCVKEVNLSSNGLGLRAAKALGEMIQNDKTVMTMSLASNHFGGKSAQVIFEALSENSTLTFLDFSKQITQSGGIGVRGAEALSKALCGKHPLSLRHLDISSNNIGADGAAALCNAFKRFRRGGESLLEKIDLSHNQFGKRGATSMGEMLKSNKTLREIDLSYNALGQYRRRDTYQKGLTALCNGLKMNSRVANVNLSGNLLGNRGAILVAEVLRNNKTLVTLELERNEIEMLGLRTLADAAKSHPMLNSLNLVGNTIRPPGNASEAGWVHHGANFHAQYNLPHLIKLSSQLPRNILVQASDVPRPLHNQTVSWEKMLERHRV